jgi:hypothetical protein
MVFITDEKIYKKAKKELNCKKVEDICKKYKKQWGKYLKNVDEFSTYFSPILAIINKHYPNLKNIKTLEIGFRYPAFIDVLKSKEAITYGIDFDPYYTGKNLLKMSVENISKEFLKEHQNSFDIIYQRLCLSRLLNEMGEKGKKFLFTKTDKILKDLTSLLKPNGMLILLDDRGTIFTLKQFKENKLKKIEKECPIILKNKNREYLGWNILAVYKKH